MLAFDLLIIKYEVKLSLSLSDLLVSLHSERTQLHFECNETALIYFTLSTMMPSTLQRANWIVPWDCKNLNLIDFKVCASFDPLLPNFMAWIFFFIMPWILYGT